MSQDRLTTKISYEEMYGGEHARRLSVLVDGEVVRKEWDMNPDCPEDHTFSRDLNWIPDAIQQAYQIGLKHGAEAAAHKQDETPMERSDAPDSSNSNGSAMARGAIVKSIHGPLEVVADDAVPEDEMWLTHEGPGGEEVTIKMKIPTP
jgi:hypothetical protein